MSTLETSDLLLNRVRFDQTNKSIAEPATRIVTSAPGRICLFGEHQDYLNLPVIAAAIDLRVEVSATVNPKRRIRVELPDIGETLEIALDHEQQYRHDRDYLPAAYNVLRRLGAYWETGWDVTVTGNLPINAGASSSSALQVAWSSFLLAAAGDSHSAADPRTVALVAHRSEVTEFGSPGGTMDHFSSAFGGLIWLDPSTGRVDQLSPVRGEFVLINSGIPKDTNGLLGATRQRIESLADYLDQCIGSTGGASATEVAAQIAEESSRITFRSTVENYLLTAEAKTAINSGAEPEVIGKLLSQHHNALINLGVSHPEIDRLLSAGLECGALGGKINGSGGGGSFFLLVNDHSKELQQFYNELGLQAWVVQASPGVAVAVNYDDSGANDR